MTDDLFCPACGYNVRGLTSNRCPECGEAYDPTTLRVSRIPWVHRREIGSVRAYLRTAGMVIFHNAEFCSEMARSVDYRASQRFRWVTIAIVFASLLTVASYSAVLIVASNNRAFGSLTADLVALVICLCCALLFHVVVSGVPSYFFQSKTLSVEQQNRAVALSYYAPAVLAATPLIAAIVLAAMVCSHYDLATIGETLTLAAFCAYFAQNLVLWFDLLHIYHRTTHRGATCIMLLGAGMPLLWLLSAGLIFIGIPGAVFYVVVMIHSSLS